MGELRVLSGREVCSILEAHGFTQVRQRGSHIVMQRRDGAGTTTVPVPDHRELAIGTLRSIAAYSRGSRVVRASSASAASASTAQPGLLLLTRRQPSLGLRVAIRRDAIGGDGVQQLSVDALLMSTAANSGQHSRIFDSRITITRLDRTLEPEAGRLG